MALQRAQGLTLALGALTGGLLSSSCCIIQLALNSLSMGCAGFSVLTPYQPVLRLATAALLVSLVATQGVNRRTLGTVAASLLLMGSQQALRLYNTGALSRGVEQWLAQRGLDATGSAWWVQRLRPPPLPPVAARLTLEVRGLRCEGCAARLRSMLEAVDGVHNATVHFSNAQAEVWVDAARVRPAQLVHAVEALDASYAAVARDAACFDAGGNPAACGAAAGAQMVARPEL